MIAWCHDPADARTLIEARLISTCPGTQSPKAYGEFMVDSD